METLSDPCTHQRVSEASRDEDHSNLYFLRTKAVLEVDTYEVGSAISAAVSIDFTADLKEVDGKPSARRGRIPGITHNPRLAEVTLR